MPAAENDVRVCLLPGEKPLGSTKGILVRRKFKAKEKEETGGISRRCIWAILFSKIKPFLIVLMSEISSAW